jgi:methionine-rich copper-binding protein CopC
MGRLGAPLRRARALALVALAALALAPPGAHGHARLGRSNPAPGLVVPADHPARRMSLWFTEPVGVGPGAVVVLDGQGRRVGASPARVAAEDPRCVDHVAFLGGGSASSGAAGLAVIRADGYGLVRLTTQPGHRGVDWAPAAPARARRR